MLSHSVTLACIGLRRHRGGLTQRPASPEAGEPIHQASEGQNEPQKWKAGCPGAPRMGISVDW